MDWKGKFDRIWCISYTGYPERRKPLERELDRVGILGSGVLEWHYTFKSIFDNILFDVTKGVNANETVNATITSVALAHYHCIKASYELGDRRCLILEDDIRFLKDVSSLRELIDELPEDSDIALLDHVNNAAKWADADEFKRNPSGMYEHVGRHFRRFGMLLGGGCYALSRRAMAMIIEMYEHCIEPADVYMAQRTLNTDLNRICAEPAAAIQVEFEECNSSFEFGKEVVVRVYRENGVDSSMYADNDHGHAIREAILPGYQRRIGSCGSRVPWNEKFDRIWCIAFTGYPDRPIPMLKELKRVGIYDSGLLEWKVNVPSCFDDIMFDLTCRMNMNTTKSKGVMSSVFGHYACVKASLELGDKRILVMEDDIRFLKDVDRLSRIVSSIRDDSDIVLLDYYCAYTGDESETRRRFASYRDDVVDDVFSRYGEMCSAGCYALSKRAMEDIVRRCESKIEPFDMYLSTISGNRNLNMHFPRDQAACQTPVLFDTSNNSKVFGYGAAAFAARLTGIDYSLFNV